jgi:predicted O-methyltransferase YrrM
MRHVSRFVRVVQWRLLEGEGREAYIDHIFPLIEPLFMIDTHMSFEERVTLFMLAASLGEGFVAGEVGSYLGASTSFLAAAASVRHGHVHAVDTWQNDAMPGSLPEDTWQRFCENTMRFRDWITTHRGPAGQMKDRVPALDLLFLDGDHSYDGTRADLVNYAPKLKPGGVLVLHDFNYDTVQRAVRDYFQERPLQNAGRTDSLQAFRLP